tara:strand:- start:2043 stop:2333 length:291 start_codon:yes stop_codon:yes gene_type:complete
MAQFARILNEQPEPKKKPPPERENRLEAVILKSERLAHLSRTPGLNGQAKEYRKKAHSKARVAMRLMGILNIEFGQDVTDDMGRIRKVLDVVKKKQ